MRILIVGAGVIGTIYGWALASAGHDVTHLVRAGRAQKLAGGIPMDVLDTRPGAQKHNLGTYALKTVESLAAGDGYELIVVPTKHYQLGETLRQIVGGAGEADFLIFTGNWCGTAEVDAILPQARYLWGDPIAGGGFKDGVLVASLSPRVVMGEINGRNSPRLQTIRELFGSARIKTEIPENIIHWHWLQFAINGALLGALASFGGVDQISLRRGIINRALFAVKEGIDVCIQRGVDINKYPGPKRSYDVSALNRLVSAAGLFYLVKFNESARRNMAHALNNPREVNAFYGEVLHTGREFGVPMPNYASFEDDVAGFVQALSARAATSNP